MNPITVDVVSDVVCPWCYIGKRQLEAAVERWSRQPRDATVEIAWHAFQLNPDVPPEGIARDDYLLRKFGSADTKRLYARVAAAAESVGLAMDFERIARQPNTLAAHALIAAAQPGARQQSMVEELFRSYFVDGVDLSRRENLLAVAERAGMPRATAAEAIDDRSALDAIARAEHELRERGVSGVPLFLVDRRIGVRGAQGADAIVSALERAAQARQETVQDDRPTRS